MKRIAFFVEGQTEQIFLNRLVKEILGTQHTNVLLKQFRGGANIPKQEIVITRSVAIKPLYEVLISDCGSDNRVKSEMLDNLESMRESGYCMLVGLRDLYPISREDLPKLQKGLHFLPNSLKNEALFFRIIIAIHEVEAWFLADKYLYKKIDKRLTGTYIKQYLGFDPTSIDPESRIHPAKDLDNIYRLIGKSYTKRYWQVMRLVNNLDIDYLKNNIRYDIEPLNQLVTILENLKK